MPLRTRLVGHLVPYIVCFFLLLPLLNESQMLQAPRTIFDDLFEINEEKEIAEESFQEELEEESSTNEDDEDENENSGLPIYLMSEYLDLLPSEQFVLYKIFVANLDRNLSTLTLDDYVG
ncbi:uncharacterized protein LOC118204936 [Stegodyphus dumicola]|uniref:uncharacterized protein LOC118204936 n=1 Tax=Stegodyphus dumicola TaxID=202533 RepID=UPI0015A952AD|nr:uncharacterized protein LOC118204936 [Stegodyphus dumicola]